MEERSVLIKMRDGEYLIVPKDQLTTNSSKFRRIFDELKNDEHEIEDFSSEAVKTFIKLLEVKLLGNLEDNLFREVHKLAVVFEVDWLKSSCCGWLKDKMIISSSNEDKVFMLEECWFMIDKWDDETMMDELISVFAHENNELLLHHCLSDISKLKAGKIDALLKLGGKNVELFLKIILNGLIGKKTLDQKLKYLLQNLNLAFCCEVNEELYLEVIDTVSNLQEISVSDLRFVHQLTSNTVKLVRSRTQERIRRKHASLFNALHLYATNRGGWLGGVLQALSDDLVPSVFVAIDLLFSMFYPYRFKRIDIERAELDLFITSLEKLCSDKNLQKVSRNFLDNMIADFKYSEYCHIKIPLTYLLDKIRNNKKMCTTYENVVLTKQDGGFKDRKNKYLYFFKHPLSANCEESGSKCGFIITRYAGTIVSELCTDKEEYANSGMHLHDYISARDMYEYPTVSGIYKGKQITASGLSEWWSLYLDKCDWEDQGTSVMYNVGNYLCEK